SPILPPRSTRRSPPAVPCAHGTATGRASPLTSRCSSRRFPSRSGRRVCTSPPARSRAPRDRRTSSSHHTKPSPPPTGTSSAGRTHPGAGSSWRAGPRRAHGGGPPRGRLHRRRHRAARAGGRGVAGLTMVSGEMRPERRGGALWITVDRRLARNAMTFAMYDRIAAICRDANADRTVRAVVLTGANEAFVAGTDIAQFADFNTAEQAVAYARRMDAWLGATEAVSVPTAAAVGGRA